MRIEPILFRAFFYGWVLLFSCNIAVATETSLHLDLTPTWNGYVKVGKMTEVLVHLSSSKGGSVIISSDQIKQTIHLKPDTPSLAPFPLVTRSTDPVTIRAVREDESSSLVEKQVPLKPFIGINQVIITTDLSKDMLETISIQNSDKHIIYLDAHFLPYTFQAYSAIDSMALHYQALTVMNEHQIQALYQYIAQCGKLVTVQFPDAVFNRFISNAGCHSKGITKQSTINKEIPVTVKNLPSSKTLHNLRSKNWISTPYTTLIIFCLGYVLILLFANLSKQTLSLIWLPILASTLALLIWYQHEPNRYLISWSEMDAHQSSAQFSTLLQSQGMGNWHETIELPSDILLTKNLLINNKQQNYIPPPINTVLYDTSSSLLSFNEWYWESSLQVDSPFCFEEGNLYPTITNISQEPSPKGFLKWNHQFFRLPTLNPGQKWQVTNTPKSPPMSALLSLMKRRSQEVAAALLIPFKPFTLKQIDEHTGWLLIVVNTEQQAETSCAQAA